MKFYSLNKNKNAKSSPNSKNNEPLASGPTKTDLIPPLTISKKTNHSHRLATGPYPFQTTNKKIVPAHKKSMKSFSVSRFAKWTHIDQKFTIRMEPRKNKILWTDWSQLQGKINPLDTKISFKTIQKFTQIDKKNPRPRLATLKNSVSL